MTAGRKRTKQQRELDLSVLAQWVAEGLEPLQMTARLNALRAPDGYTLTPQQVNYDLRDLDRRWRAGQRQSIDEARQAQLLKLRHVYRTMWQEWYASKAPRETTQTRQSELLTAATEAGADGRPAARPITGNRTAVVRREQRQGDPRYMKLALEALTAEIKLLGTGATDEQSARLMRAEAEKIAREMGISVDEVMAEVNRIMNGGA